MGTGRLEAFSDGVFAIAITLLILEIRVPANSGARLGDDLLHIWPSYFAYVTSFLTIGIMWINHHALFQRIGRVDRMLLLINTLFLMLVAFVPFPTRLVAEHLHGAGERDAALAYGITFVITALFFNAFWLYASRGRRLIPESIPQARIDEITRGYAPGVFIYGAATLVALASPIAAIGLFLAIAVFYALPESLWDRMLRRPVR
ncbi:MAG: potassium channel family protein [Gaiellaceae bacterium]|nr:potassium channel family protein [Gaiellaceae bacterium]